MSKPRRSLIGAVVAALAAAPLTVVAVAAVTSPANAATPAQQKSTWRNVEIQGGGFVPGIVFSQAQKDLIYARTDIGGMYRWNPSTSRWIPLLDWVGADNWGCNGVVSIAADPTDAAKVYAAVGMYTNDWDPNNGAIIRSSDKGDTWQVSKLPFKLGGNMPGRGMGERLAVDPNKPSTLYFAAPSKKGLWRSTDSGATWAQVSAFPNAGTYVQDSSQPYLADSPGVVWVQFDRSTGSAGAGSKTIYVGVADVDNSIYRSTDGGTTWSRVPNQPTGYLPHKAVIDTTNKVMYVAYSNTQGPYDGDKGILQRLDLTTGTWTDISPVKLSAGADLHFGYSGLTVDRQKPKTLIVASQVSWWPDAVFWRSTDGGTTWSQIWDWTSYPSRSFKYKQDITEVPWLNFGVTKPVEPDTAPKLGWMNESVEIDPFNSDRLMYGTGATIYGTTDLTKWDTGGQFTIKPMVGGLEETAVLDLISPPSGPTLVSALGDIGGFVHTDLTKVPSTMFTGPTFTSTRSLDYAELKPEILVRAGDFTASDRPNDHHVAFSTDAGKSWFQASAEPGGINSGGTIAASSDGQRFVWAPGDAGQQVVVSEGLGYQWKPVQGLTAQSVIESDRVNPKTFYAFKDGSFFRSTDGGATFTATVKTGLPTSARFKAVAGREGDIWLAGSTGLFRSTDGGTSFTKVSSVDAGSSVGFGKAAPGASYQAVYLIGSVGGVAGAFRSDDAGATWVRINDDQHQYGNWGEAVTGDPRVYGRVYVGTNGRGIVYADPAGTTTTPPVTTTKPTTTTPVPTTTSPKPSTTSPTGKTTKKTSTKKTSTKKSSVKVRCKTGKNGKKTCKTITKKAKAALAPAVVSASGCSVAYRVTDSWPGGFRAEVAVTADRAASGWSLTWPGATAASAWGASTTGTAVVGGALAASTTASAGILASGTPAAAPTVSCSAS
ncbi:MAG: xyloglucanase [Kineosporiaceae bacterium]